MIRMSRRKGARRAVSTLALALALGCGTVVATGITAPAAYAQDNSRGFVEAYNEVMAAEKGESPDWNVVKTKLPELVAAISTEKDRLLAGQIHLQTGTNLQDPALQRAGLEMMLASGMVEPENVGRFQFFVGSLAINAGDYAEARTALQASWDAGYRDEDIRGLIGESYMREGNEAQAVAYLMEQARTEAAAGNPVPEAWVLRALQTAYDSDMVEAGNEAALMAVQLHPSPKNFSSALQIINGLNETTPQVQLDLLRLLRIADSLPLREYSVMYIENADPRIMSNEVVDVLAEGLAAGQFDATDTYYVEVKNIADGRTAADQADAPELVAEAEAASDVQSALIAGDVNWSIDNFAVAESMYALAAMRDPTNATAKMREGMAQVQQGKYAEAAATFDSVPEGDRTMVAALWKAYAVYMAG